ncbi:hypothetical protein Pdw03_8278 [Penicillium digitatum]|uniref:Uncharacterized protein n=1 Tax=Penicillium digitatum TaxID=36651 RepID=A0A7T7BLP0_PENDI|nr:hypothetical protein Pdw03_8278 [Penicillium digitatum]
MHQSFPGRGICTAISKVCKVTDTVQQPLVTCAEDSGWNNQTPYTTKTAQKTSQSVSFPPSCKIKIVEIENEKKTSKNLDSCKQKKEPPLFFHCRARL